ncbi:hypothetical protein KYI11_11585 [Macrococcoides bohemicum]|uniref:Uncharacterized protein n=1 Tax=Macrococcoides bohemicum TaxID=1903056 RepID=A0AAJ4P7Y6_9STAP|nr:hypothetical protein [Macrococcus bohemicus]QYA42218.1 hypothetical protein KYI11_11585 [Macrococcus bohemicus]
MNFAKQINMAPMLVKKEQPGYILNSLLAPLLQSAEMLLTNGVGGAETVDRAWMIGTVEGFYTYPNPSYKAPDFLKG